MKTQKNTVFKFLFSFTLFLLLTLNTFSQGNLSPDTTAAPSMHSLEQIWQTLDGSNAELQKQQQQLETSTTILNSTETKLNNLAINNHYLIEHFGIQQTWITKTIDTLGDTGNFTSIAISPEGFPAISYFDWVNNDLRFIYANDPQGKSWKNPVIVNERGYVNNLTSLAFSPEGFPAICYYDRNTQSLKFVYSNDRNGISWGDPVVVDEGVGEYASLAFSPHSLPAIGYYDQTKSNLKFAYANDKQGSSWTTRTVIDSQNDVGKYCSLAFSPDGHPGIACKDSSAGNLIFIRAFGELTSWAEPVIVDQIQRLYHNLSFEYSAEGFAAIGYEDLENQDLKFIRANDKDGESWNTPIIVDSQDSHIRNISLAFSPLDLPAIAYLTESGPGWSFKFAQSKDNKGDTWKDSIIIDSESKTGLFGSLIFSPEGLPMISYQKETTRDLKFAIRSPFVNP